MTPALQPEDAPSESVPGRRRGVVALLAVLAVAPGCAGRQARYWDLGAKTPPTLSTEPVVRSQDSLARRQPRNRQVREQSVAQAEPPVQWSDESGTAAPRTIRTTGETNRPAVVTLPPPPTIPEGLPRPEAVAGPAVAAATPPPGPTPPDSTTAPTLAAPVLTAPPATADAQGPTPAAPVDGIRQMRELIDAGRARLASLTNYQVTMARQERVGDSLMPAETVLLSLRREPLAVRLEWPSGKSQGREVIYSPQETRGQLQIYSPGTLMPRVTLAPTSALVMRNSRHPITEAGFGSILDTLDRSLQPHEQGQAIRARMVYAGQETPAEVGRPCHKLVEDRENGEHWEVFLDTASGLPALVHGTTGSGDLLEHYVFGDVRTDLPDLASATAFDPDARWGGKGGGLLGRLSRGGSDAGNGSTTGPR